MLNIVTLAYAAMPWITHHYEQWSRLSIPWHWTIAYGRALPVRDTGWCKEPPVVDDGTLGYLMALAAKDGRVTALAAKEWQGKTAMCNACLGSFADDGLVLQVDADELWTAEQVEAMAAMMERTPQADSALFRCRYFVGPDRYTTTPDAYGNYTKYEWARLWRWTRRQLFIMHEPPRLEGSRYFLPHAATEAAGLVFDHMAYATREQVAFKEKYYGYAGAVAAWEKLQQAELPCRLADYLPWVKDGAIVRRRE